jgi:2-C-methyl-D-erythritol 4-phosphate cytidylyltransferase
VVIAAAGVGRRFGGAKQFLRLAGRPAVHYSLDVFAALEDIGRIAVVVSAADLELGRETVDAWGAGAAPPASRPSVVVVAGGARRQDSVVAGLEALAGEAAFVLVHDAARPLVRVEDARRLLDAVKAKGAAVLGTRAHDSLKRAREAWVVGELAREEVWLAQTPQGAGLAALRAAYAREPSTDWTDEASALRAAGLEVALVEGSPENLKITRPGDEALAEAILVARARRASSR